MMLPQFGFIVAQAGADSHTLPPVPPPPVVVPQSAASTSTVLTNNGNNSSNNSPRAPTSALAPLLHNKPIYNLSQTNSSHMSTTTSSDGYYNTYNNNSNTASPFYSRQPSPSITNVIHQQQQPILPTPPPPPPTNTSTQQRVVTPPPPPMFNNYQHHSQHQPQTHKEIMPKIENRGAFTPSSSLETSTYNKKKKQQDNSPWYRPHQQNNHSPYYNDHHSSIQGQERQQFIDHGNNHHYGNKWHDSMTMNNHSHSHSHKATTTTTTRVTPPSPTPPVQITSNTNTATSHRQDVKEYNDLMTWMDNEFWEQADEIYQEKLANLQNELINIQKGTHSAFREMIADFEYQREKTISDAECFMKYQISFIQHYFDQDINALEDEYENERRHLQDTLIHSIEDKKRQIKDDRDESNDNEENNNNTNNNKGNTSKRNLRKRNADLTTAAALRSEPLSKRRAVRPSTLHNIHTISPLEDEELEEEFLNMKKAAATNKLFA